MDIKLDLSKSYSRINNVVYENGIPIFKHTGSRFIDVEKFNDSTINYTNRYIEINPGLIEILKPMKRIVKLFYDLETTGTDERKHGIHQISGIIEVDGEIAEKFNFKVAPNPKAQIEPEALTVGGVTEEQIRAYPEMRKVYFAILKILGKYCDRFNAKDKIWLVGFNNRKFDDVFFRCWFEQNGDTFFGSWFWSDSLDALVFASQYLIDRRRDMPSFKLKRVAKELGIDVDETKLHDAEYDIMLTREVYRIAVGLEIEI